MPVREALVTVGVRIISEHCRSFRMGFGKGAKWGKGGVGRPGLRGGGNSGRGCHQILPLPSIPNLATGSCTCLRQQFHCCRTEESHGGCWGFPWARDKSPLGGPPQPHCPHWIPQQLFLCCCITAWTVQKELGCQFLQLCQNIKQQQNS